MIDHFPEFANLIDQMYKKVQKSTLFMVEPLDIYASYLASFPEGTNPIFRERSHHDCSCCKQFIRTLGRVVSIKDDKLQTVWDDACNAPYPYNEVAKSMSALVRQQYIVSHFYTKEPQYGVSHTYEGNRKWQHLSGKVNSNCLTSKPDEMKGKKNLTELLRRALHELKETALVTVIDLIESDNLYRGAEHLSSIKNFKRLLDAYLLSSAKEFFLWENVEDRAVRFRNTVIGTLVADISEGVPLEDAVRMFESKVAPLNYKRPKTLVTPKMVDDAIAALSNLGLESALNRRHAKLSDISVNNVLFVNNATLLKGSIASLMSNSVIRKSVNLVNAPEVTIETFMKEVVPSCKNISVILENKHLNNLVSLTAPAEEEVGKLFKWDNNFAWSYEGGVADSLIKARVQQAGGNVEAKLRVSLSWSNEDDLDLHAFTPEGKRINFSNKAGILDVDMNVHSISKNPVENMAFTTLSNGVYQFFVDKYTPRSNKNLGFTIEIESNEQFLQIPFNDPTSRKMPVVNITIVDGVIDKIQSKVKVVTPTRTKWGISTHTPLPVETIMLSPNYWDEQTTGNKHWFFVLKDCKNPEPTRGIYNEFLKSELEPHRKFFEILAGKTKCDVVDDQLSGVGFSSTKRDQVVVTADGRPYTLTF